MSGAQPPPDIERDELDLIIEEFSARRRRGEPAGIIDEYLERYPHLQEELRVVLPTLDFIGRATDSAEPVPSTPLAVGTRLGDFEISGEVGRGGMGVVYEAHQASLDRHVALKILPVQATLDPRFLERFRREAQAAAGLQHPHIVPIYGVGEVDGIHYFAMQYIDGHGLDQVVESARRVWDDGKPWANEPILAPFGRSRESYYKRVAAVVRDVAHALAFAHGRGIQHRDIKPSNLLLDSQQQIWITDFGLCQTASSGDLTRVGDLVGTLRFMPPERLEGRSDPTGDVYSLGLTLYELATRRPAYTGTDHAQVLRAISEHEPSRPTATDPTIPRDLETIILRATARTPEERYPSAQALGQDLQAFLDERPITARPPTLMYVLRKAVRRNRLLASTVAIATLLLVASSFLYVVGLNRTLKRTRALGLASAAAEAGQSDPMLGLLLAREAVRLEPSPVTLSQLQRALAAFHERAEMGGFQSSVQDAVLSPDGQHILVHSSRKAQLHDEKGTLLREFEAPGGPILGCAFSPAGDRLLIASTRGSVACLDLQGAGPTVTCPGEGPLIEASFVGSRVLTARADGHIQIWSPSGTPMRSHRVPPGVQAVALAPDGSRLAAVTREGVGVWESGEEPVVTLKPPETGTPLERPRALTFSPDGALLLTRSSDQLGVWDREGNLRGLLDEHTDTINSAAFSRDGQTVLSASEDQTLRLWRWEPDEVIVLRGHGGGITYAEFSPDEQMIISSANDQTARLWDPTGRPLATFLGHASRVTRARFAPDGQSIITASSDRTARLWSVQPLGFPILRGHRGGLYSAVFSPDGEQICTTSRDSQVKLWSLDGRCQRTLDGHGRWVYSSRYSRDSSLFLTTAESSEAILWKRSGEVAGELVVERGRILNAFFTDRGIQALHRPTPVTVVRRSFDGEEQARYEGHTEVVWYADLSPALTHVVTASGDDTASVWSADGTHLATLSGHDGDVRCARFAPDGKSVATASDDGTARLWNLSGQTLCTFRGHEGAVLSVAFAPDGEHLVTSSRDRTARVWNLAGEQERLLRGHDGVVWTAEYSAGGRQIVTAANDQTARVWLLERADLLELADRLAFRGFSEAERSRYDELLD